MSSGTPPTWVAMVGTRQADGFEGGEAEGFEFARHEEEVGEGQNFRDAALLAEEVDAVLNSLAVGDPFRQQSDPGRHRS